MHFTWKFNTSSAENLDLPASLIAVDRAKSIAHYTPMTEQVRDRAYLSTYRIAYTIHMKDVRNVS